MTIFLAILLILAIIGAAVMLIRGLIAFLKTTEEDLKNSNVGPSASSIKQNKMMMGRVIFQGLAVLIVILILAMQRG